MDPAPANTFPSVLHMFLESEQDKVSEFQRCSKAQKVEMSGLYTGLSFCDLVDRVLAFDYEVLDSNLFTTMKFCD